MLFLLGLLGIETPRQREYGEPRIVAAARQELAWAHRQRLLAEHILIGIKLNEFDGAFAPAVELPQCVVVSLDEAHVVEVHVVRGLGRDGVALASCVVMGTGEGLASLEELCALDGAKGNGLFDELVELGVGLCAVCVLAEVQERWHFLFLRVCLVLERTYRSGPLLVRLRQHAKDP